MVNFPAVDFHHGVSNAHEQLALDDTLQINPVSSQFVIRRDLSSEFDFTRTECTTAARATQPAEVETDQLPQGVKTKAAWHDRIGFEMAFKEPQVRFDVEFGNYLPLPVGTTFSTDMDDAVEHQHWRQRQTRIARAKQLAMTAAEKFFVRVLILSIRRQSLCCCHMVATNRLAGYSNSLF